MPPAIDQHKPTEIDETFSAIAVNTSKYAFKDFDHSHIPLEKDGWPVIIIGSSMVGKMLGLLLGYHG